QSQGMGDGLQCPGGGLDVLVPVDEREDVVFVHDGPREGKGASIKYRATDCCLTVGRPATARAARRPPFPDTRAYMHNTVLPREGQVARAAASHRQPAHGGASPGPA